MKSFNQKLIEQDIKGYLNSSSDFDKVCGDCKLILEAAKFVECFDEFNNRQIYDFDKAIKGWDRLHEVLYPVAKQIYDDVHKKANKDLLDDEG